MPEAEVSLRLAIFLIENELASSNVSVAIDGAQIRTGNIIHFDIDEFLRVNCIKKITSNLGWQGTYQLKSYNRFIEVHSRPGQGDVAATLISGDVLRVESKKGPLAKSKSSEEYRLLREALGQLLTIEEHASMDRLAVAIPNSPKFAELAKCWSNAPLIKQLRIDFILVGPDGEIKIYNSRGVVNSESFF